MIKNFSSLKSSFIVFLLLFSCVGFATSNNAEIICRDIVKSVDIISIVVRVKNDDQSINSSVNGNFKVLSSSANLENDSIKIVKGVGSLTSEIHASEDFVITIESFSGQKTVSVDNDTPISFVSGEIEINTTWTADTIVFINEDLIVSQNTTLTIEQGCRVIWGEKVNLFVNGELVITGSIQSPVFFQPATTDLPWGGILLANAAFSNIEYCFFVNGGDNEDYIFGHSNSQPVILIENASLEISNAFFIDNPGKAFGSSNSQIEINKCVISRCDTGGEYMSSLVSISDSYYLDIPNGDGVSMDDDNDASYFNGVYPNATQPSVVDNCVFVTGKDDAIDHNGANLEIRNCWIDGFDNEGIAASNANNIFIYNTLIKNCEQGIEAGYGNPNVIVDHCTMINNDVGLRFGDWYNWGCEGHILATNSILYNNTDNVFNFDVLTQGPVADAIDISYSMTNDTEYDDYPNCITGIPLFDDDYTILPGSPGVGLALDGSNLGLINPNMSIYENEIVGGSNFQVSPNPFRNKCDLSFTLTKKEDVLFRVFDVYGNLIFEKHNSQLLPGKQLIYFQKNELEPGLYFFTLLLNDNQFFTKKLISQ